MHLPPVIEFSDLVDFCESFFFINNIPEPTCVTSTMKSLIDAALTSNQERFSTSRVLQFGLSDHNLMYVVRKNKLLRPKPRFAKCCSLKRFDQELFCLISKRFPGELLLVIILQTMCELIGVPCTRIFSINMPG